MLVLGIDPGTIRTGWGVVRREGTRLLPVAYSVIRAPQKAELSARLKLIYDGLSNVVTEFAPDAVAVEDVFFAKHPNAALKLGHARGVALLVAAQAGLEVSAYPPALVKKTVVGKGRADKNQVGLIVKAILGLKEMAQEDAGDALAIAITHHSAMRR